MAGRIRDRRTGNRSGGGRPKGTGESGPNPVALAMREAFGIGIGQPFTPLGVSEVRRWLGEADLRTAQTFAGLHRAAHLDGPRMPAQSDLSNPEAVDVRKVSWSAMSGAEIVAVWESALRDVRGPSDNAEGFAAAAMQRWKQACAAMTADQLREVCRFCVDDSWPQWIIQRNAGRFDTSWERQRDLLIGGLRAVAIALRPAPERRAA